MLKMSGRTTSKEDVKKCNICEKDEAKYRCPKCTIPYCSVSCYRSAKHLTCSESFYKQEVEHELKRMKIEDGSKRSTLRALSNLGMQDSNDFDADTDSDEEFASLRKRMENVNINDFENVWSRLTAEEREEFDNRLKNNRFEELFSNYTPWWNFVRQSENDGANKEGVCPEILKNIPEFSVLTLSKPNDCIIFNIHNVLAAYTYTVREFFEEHHYSNAKIESSKMIMEFSQNLNSNVVFHNFDEAIQSVYDQIVQSEEYDVKEETLEYMRLDVAALLDGPNENKRNYYLLAALSDIHELFQEALLYKVKDEGHGSLKINKRELFTSTEKIALKRSSKKLMYYLAWAKKYVV